MVLLDATIVNIALPSAQKSLGFSTVDRQWVVTAYALAFGSLLLLGGRISDLFGRKRAFLVGLAGFAAASALGGIAQSFGVLIFARALQGIFGALLAPAALSLLTTTFTDARERNTAFGIFSAVGGSGAALGLLLGGALTEWLTWRWCLYVNVAFAAVAIVGGAILLSSSRPSERPHLDLPGTITVSAGLFALVYGFSNASSHSWGDPLTLGMLAASVVLIALFAHIERGANVPLLPLRIVLDRNRGGAFLSIGIASMAIFAVFLFLTFYLQQNLGYSPIKTGLAFLPLTGAIAASAALSSARLTGLLGPRRLVSGGMALAAVGMVTLAQLDASSTYVTGVLPGLILIGVGFGAIYAPSLNLSTSDVREADSGVASAMVNIAQQVGGAVGTALLSTLAASAASSFAGGRPKTQSIAGEAAVHGYTTAFWVAAGIFACGAGLAAALLRTPTGVATRLS